MERVKVMALKFQDDLSMVVVDTVGTISGILLVKGIFDHTSAHLHLVLPKDLPAHSIRHTHSTPRTPLRPRPKEGVLVAEAFYNLQVLPDQRPANPHRGHRRPDEADRKS
ncbi:uncharacterized protein LOC111707231, partial [Eurytemora carolleeae]|uniref:uncharacterized protein LOC111707231 n=1 Tax=Eurytemora carolleeae TaxID=1294199 RepID=UPI000C757DAD